MSVATYGAECWTLEKDAAERLVSFERKGVRRMFGGIKVSETWRKRCDGELMQLCGDLGILRCVRISRLDWIGRVNRMDRKRKVSHVFNNNPQGNRRRGRPKNRWWWNCVQILIDIKLRTGKTGQKTEAKVRSGP
jgi:hypothetical protein